MDWEMIIVVGIVSVTAGVLGLRAQRKLRATLDAPQGSACSGGCGSCGEASSCELPQSQGSSKLPVITPPRR